MQEKIIMIFRKFLKSVYSGEKNSLSLLVKKISLIIGLLSFSYILSGVAISFILPTLIDAISNSNPIVTKAERFKVDSSNINFRDIKKGILDRNIFNLEGNFPDETIEEEDLVFDDVFDINASCQDSKLPLKLVGTIFFSEGKETVAVVREKGVEDVDVYLKGEFLVGQEGVQVALIQPKVLILNNNGKKECIYTSKEDQISSKKAFQSKTINQNKDTSPKSFLLQSSWVESELGDGFGNVLQSARMVPVQEGDVFKGFKFFSIKKGSLLDKSGIKNNDIVTKINDTPLTADNGFSLYEAFQNEDLIRIYILRDSKPSSLEVEIK